MFYSKWEDRDLGVSSASVSVVSFFELFNSMVPLWQRKRSDVTKDEYDEFYKQTFQDDMNPLETITVSAEGVVGSGSVVG